MTSKGVGMAVPDWPTSYGYNMFLFPIDQWIGGVFYEHTHRLLASAVGLLTAILTGWIWVRETSGWRRRAGLIAIVITLGLVGVRTQGMFVVLACVALAFLVFGLSRAVVDERPLRWWAAIAFATVLVQGVLGGLRVTAMVDQIGIFHGTLAQLFLVLLVLLALGTGGWLDRKANHDQAGLPAALPKWLLGVTILILVQLMLGAAMRHQHAGLAVPDFPLAHGQLYPPTDAEAIQAYNVQRMDSRDFHSITPFQVHLHMLHRMVALSLLLVVPWGALRFRAATAGRDVPGRALAGWWLALIGVQATLGVITVLKNKPADIATAHVMVGALCLVIGAVLTRVAREFSVATENPVMQTRAHSRRPIGTTTPVIQQ